MLQTKLRIYERRSGTHRTRSSLVAGLAAAAMLFASPAATARPASSADEPRLSGPGVDISVTIPAGWHQIGDLPTGGTLRIPQMVYPDTCSVGIECAMAMALVMSEQATSPRMEAEAVEQGFAGAPGVQSTRVISQGPTQIAGRPGYYIRFTFTKPAVQGQAEAAAVETGPTSSTETAAVGTGPTSSIGVRTSVVFVTVSDLPGAPSTSVIDLIVGSTQLTTQ
jgi:hypothetical protein